MKKLVLFFAVVLALVLVVPVGAQGPNVYDSGFQVQNLSGTDAANIVIDYYNMDGTMATSFSASIPAGSSATYFPHASAGFDGSVVISSDQPIAAITNVTGDSYTFGASYSGFSAGATSVIIPLLMNANYGYSTWMNVQNVDDATAANVTVTYASDGCTETATIQPGAAARFDQTAGSCMNPAEVDSAVITSNVPVVTTVIETGAKTLFAYNGFLPSEAATDIVMPLVQALNYGYSTGIQIQNNGGSATTITLTYTQASDGSTCTETGTIPAGQSVTFALGALAHIGAVPGSTTCAGTSAFVGGAAVTANSAGTNLVAIVNQLNFNTGDKGAASNSFNPANATDLVMFPLIMEANYGFFTGFNVMNIGASTTTVVCTFVNNAYTVSKILAPGEVLNAVQYGTALPDPYVGGATCDGAGVDIIGIANELGSGAGDNFYAYDAFNN